VKNKITGMLYYWYSTVQVVHKVSVQVAMGNAEGVWGVCMKYALECSDFDCFEKMESADLANGCIFLNLRIFTMVIFYFIV
jgi:hypothetical protein